MDPVAPSTAGAVAPATQIVTPPTAPQATALGVNPAQVQMPSDVLAARLDEERRKGAAALLKDLGVENIDAIKAVIAAAKQAEDAKKTEAEKLLGRISELEPAAKRVAELEAVVKAQADAALQSLTEAQRAAVTSALQTLGKADDPAAQLSMVAAVRSAAPVAATAQAPAPATTTPQVHAPAPANPAVANHLASWESLKKTNPVEAARYYITHRAAIAEARKASPSP